MELNVTWYIDCSHVNLGCCLGNQCFTWPLYERDLTTDALTNDLDNFQFALCNGDTINANTSMICTLCLKTDQRGFNFKNPRK